MKFVRLLIKLALSFFLLSSFIGLLASFKISFPFEIVGFLDFRLIRPLHVFLAIGGQLIGVISISFILNNKYNLTKIYISSFIFLIAFLILGVISLLYGLSSGREYINWVPILSPFLLIAAGISAAHIFLKRKPLVDINPEGFWLLFMGHFFLIGGLVESHLWLFSTINKNLVQDLTIQWHGIDAFIAGINISLYGGLMFMLNSKPKPLRKRTLYILAAFSLLFTFGHHHYISPQPFSLKILALTASLTGIVSLIKHFKEYRKMQPQQSADFALFPITQSITGWMIVSLLSGILFAIPQINLFVHGTYWIVAHAMVSMIGTNVLIIVLLAYLLTSEGSDSNERIKKGMFIVNGALILFWISFGLAGTIKFIGRIESNFTSFSSKMSLAMLGTPVAGILLVVGLSILFYDLFKRGL